MEANEVGYARVRETVERLLSARFGADILIGGERRFPYSQVSRYTLYTPGDLVPKSVIVRVLRGGARSGQDRLHNEQAALQFLTSLGSILAPRFIAADPSAGILISEDLGTGPSLLELLLGDDPDAAYDGLLAFARSLGTLHAQTAGRAPAYKKRRAQLGPLSPNVGHPGYPLPLLESWRQVRDAVTQLGLPEPPGTDEVDEIADLLLNPDACHALSSGDPSLVNCIVTDGAVRFFDFEDAGFRHALLDAIILRYPYPTGGPVWSLPAEVTDSIEWAYRQELGHACSLGEDDASYELGMAAASAAWMIVRLLRLAKVDAGPDRDAWPLLSPDWSSPIPTRSRRRQLVAIIETFIVSARRSGTLCVLATWCESMVRALRSRWPEATEGILQYPAFHR